MSDYMSWKEACIAWEICASVHSQWAKDKDALFSTRQADYKRHAEDARAKALAAATPQPPHNAPVKFPEPVEVPIQYQGVKIGTEDGGDAYAAGYFDGEAAGYARGLNENSAGNETLAHELDIVLSDDGVTLTPGAFRALTFVRAALRGEAA